MIKVCAWYGNELNPPPLLHSLSLLIITYPGIQDGDDN